MTGGCCESAGAKQEQEHLDTRRARISVSEREEKRNQLELGEETSSLQEKWPQG